MTISCDKVDPPAAPGPGLTNSTARPTMVHTGTPQHRLRRARKSLGNSKIVLEFI